MRTATEGKAMEREKKEGEVRMRMTVLRSEASLSVAFNYFLSNEN